MEKSVLLAESLSRRFGSNSERDRSRKEELSDTFDFTPNRKCQVRTLDNGSPHEKKINPP